MSSARIVYRPRADTSREFELSALASTYSFVLQCGAARRAEDKKKAAGAGHTNGDDATKGPDNAHRATARIPR